MALSPFTRAKPEVTSLRRRAETLAGSFPGLQAEAERVAAIVAQGVHGRRRAGTGETFWQYRPYDSSDAARSIDWRRSARSDALFVRETEWEASNTVWMWRDGSAGMDWSSGDYPTKKDRASVLSMALAALLIRGGERCAVLGESERPRTGRAGLERVTARMARSMGAAENLRADIPAHARILIASDFLDGAEKWRERLARLTARPASGVLLHIIDPAEENFPYTGRVRLKYPGSGVIEPLIVGRAERAREDYIARFAAHKQTMANTARRLGWSLVTHHTDQPATRALAALYTAFEGESRR
ncbi:DUF58 domain-containing protein [Robiginitomaculum antarcticum]|uniref:DUF58 domain-containing protein n=1 Tax=Robiginitomaculum antarcticum TaxID=437507 RepID=UPI0003756060|nr:DUF58 domain-containing protein [Robiginitomaculum antarcticum]